MFVRRHATNVTVTSDPSYPNVLYLDRDAETVLVQIDSDTYEVWRGRWHLGDLNFHDGDCNFGWRFATRTPIFRSSRKWFPYPEAALATRGLKVSEIRRVGAGLSHSQ